MSQFTGEVHPAAEVWPLLAADELAELVASIAEIGLTDPLTIDPSGCLLDGRNRLHACQEAEVEPEFVVYEGDPVPFILAKNGDRRHMGTGARAMATAVVLADAGYRKNGRWQRGTIDGISESRNSNWRQSLSQAGTVIDFVPALASQVIAGDLALDAAHKQAKKAKAEAESDTERTKKLKATDPRLAAQVASGDLSLAEAEGALREREAERLKAIDRHTKYLTDAVSAWDTLHAVATDSFTYQAEATERLPEGFADRLATAIQIIKKGLN